MPKGQRRPIKRFRVPPPVHNEEADPDTTFPEVSEVVKRRRELFCREYIKDFNGAQAYTRMGYNNKTPWIHASEWLKEPYTQWFLAKLVADLDEHAIVTRNEVLFGLKKEAHYHGLDGSAAARISAWRAMAKILGIEITKVEGNVNLGGGVMLMPMSGTPEEWEKAAQVAQAKLKQDVRK